MLKTEEVANILGVKKSTFHSLLNKNLFPRPDYIDRSNHGRGAYFWKEETVKKSLNERNKKTRRLENAKTDKDEIVKRVASGETIIKIAEEYGVSRTTISKMIPKPYPKTKKERISKEYEKATGWNSVNQALNIAAGIK